MKNYVSYGVFIILCLSTLTLLAAPSQVTIKHNSNQFNMSDDDLDPLVDVSVTVDIKEIRSLEKRDDKFYPTDKLNLLSNPNFYVNVLIKNETFTSPNWENMKYVNDPNWSATLNVPDNVEFVNVTIELWDAGPIGDKLCDISGNYTTYPDSFILHLQYSIKTGHWTGDDHIYHNDFYEDSDPSGYGRANGCDDNSIYQNNRDCELWFDIHQNDFDGDGIPYWTEANVFHTDPTVNNTGEDTDGDSVPIEWEFKWGFSQRQHWGNQSSEYVWLYNPNIWEDHAHLDDDNDGLTNVEEYLTSQWGSDPFRRDLFIEMDQMEGGPNGELASIFPDNAKELLQTAYDKQNIVYHLDDGSWVNSCSDTIPFDNLTTGVWGHNASNELQQIYNDYFLDGNQSNWRRGVFHYGVVIYQCSLANGNAFGGDSFQISSNGLNEKAKNPLLNRDVVYASAYMHETGHTLAIENPAVDNSNTKYPWQLGWWFFRNYRSVMNYGHMYTMVDYSDGSRGINDFNDWHNLDLTAFQRSYF